MTYNFQSLIQRSLQVFGILFLWFAAFVQTAVTQTIVYTEQHDPGANNNPSAVNGTGDGYIVIPYKNRFYYLNHHSFPHNEAFGCIEKQAGSGACAGFGTLNGTGHYKRPMPDGDLAPAGTPPLQITPTTASGNEEYAIISDRFLYFPVTRHNNNMPPQLSAWHNVQILDWGLGCFDLQTHTECGYAQIPNTNNRKYRVAAEGPFKVGNKLYLLDLEMKLHCFDAASAPVLTPCAVATKDLFADPDYKLSRYSSNGNSYSGHIGGEVVGDQLFLTVRYTTPNAQTVIEAAPSPLISVAGKMVVCIDMASSGMNSCSGWSGPRQFVSTERSDNFSNFLSYDTTMNPQAICNANATQISCLSLADGSIAPSPNLFSGANMVYFQHGLGTEITHGTRSYFPSWASQYRACYDWATQSSCPGFPLLTPIYPVGDYGYSQDEMGCAWSFGHSNKIWSFDPVTGQTPCDKIVLTGEAQATCNATNWTSLNVSTIDVANMVSPVLRVKKANGTWASFALTSASQNVSLSTPDYAGLGTIEYEIEYRLAAGVAQLNTGPYVEVSTLNPPCDLDINKAAPVLTLDNDGNGAPSLGDVLTYTITVTNTTQSPQTNVLVSDPLLTPSSNFCTTLAPGQSCVLTGTYLIDSSDLQLDKIFNTASAQSAEYPTPVTDEQITQIDCNNVIGLKTTNPCSFRYISIDKTVIVPPGVTIPPSTPFDITANCGVGLVTQQSIMVGSPAIFGAYFEGMSCTLSEGALDATILPNNCEWAAPTFSPGPIVTLNTTTQHVTEVEVVNEVICTPPPTTGTLNIMKTMAWRSGRPPSGTLFNYDISCANGFNATGSLPAGIGISVPNIPAGESCILTELTPSPIGLSFLCSYSAPNYPQGQNFSVTAGGATTLTIENNIECRRRLIGSVSHVFNFNFSTAIAPFGGGGNVITIDKLNDIPLTEGIETSYADAYGMPLEIGGEIGRAIGEDRYLLGGLSYSHSAGRDIELGRIDGQVFAGELSDLNSWTLHTGLRQYGKPWDSFGKARPFMQGRIGGVYIEAVVLKDARQGQRQLNGGTVPLYKNSWALAASAGLGLEWEISDRANIALETSIRYIGAPRSDNSYFTPGQSLAGSNGANGRVDMPIRVRASIPLK